MENLKLAHKRAKKDKNFYKEVKEVDENPDYYLKLIQDMLINKTYFVSDDDYEMFTKNDKGKIREIYKLDYAPHRIIQHALMIQIEDILRKTLIENTFASLKYRGIHRALSRLNKDVRKYPEETKYCLQIDVKKFYPTINHEINKQLYRKKFKDNDLLWLIDLLIDSLGDEEGIAIGSLFSQMNGNFYLSYFDHWIKEEKKVKFYYRYADDCLFLSDNKEDLHELLKEIKIYLCSNLKLRVKENHAIYPVDIRGIDFVGYRHFRNYILLRKSTSKKLIRKSRDIEKKMANGGRFTYKDYCSVNSYNGWIKWCNGRHLHEQWIEPNEIYADQYYDDNISKDRRKK